MSSGSETIAAIATGAGCGIGIVRISGPEALEIGARIFRGRGGRSLAATAPLHLLLGEVVDPTSGRQIDEAFAVHMRAGSSYTGETTVEIQGHGGRGILHAVLQAALAAGARIAAPGEFTKLAFLSGRIDLSQAEAVAELIGAGTERARQAALSRLRGGLGNRVRLLARRLLDQIAAGEAILDHGDEEVGAGEPDRAEVEALARELDELIALGESRDARPHGARVVIAGRTNSGKSSIFNMLCDSERAIVSPNPGTTRDYIEDRFSIDGTQVTLVDTAGLREALDPVENEGIRRSREQILEADLLILTIDSSRALEADDLRMLGESLERSPLVVITKVDLREEMDRERLLETCRGLRVLSLSTADGRGCHELRKAVAERCREDALDDEVAAPNLRHRDSLRKAGASLRIAADLLQRHPVPLDQAVTELRSAAVALGQITGETLDEEILERIFSRFCIGK